MRMQTPVRVMVAVSLAATVAATTAAAQEAGRGFLFGPPRATVTLRAGYAGANAGSDIFSFVTSQLTVNHSDFGAFAIAADLAIPVASRFDLVFSVDNSARSKKSEYREWQDNSGNPIEQSTSFSRLTFSASGRYYLLPPGRSLGRLAWIPSRYAPWISAGIGRTAYHFDQAGDFVDFNNGNSVFPDSFGASQWATTGEVAAGVDWSLNQLFALTTQAKYLFGKADLQGDYSGFGPIDLSGVGLSAGLTIRF